MDLNALTSQIIGAAIEAHKELGPGLFESVYRRCMVIELGKRGLRVATELPVQVKYKGEVVSDDGLRLDLLVENGVIIELKSVAEILDVHKKQLLTYLRLTGKEVGLLINFNVAFLRDGIVRIVNGFKEKPDLDASGNLGPT